jgi:hypothetical protein
VRLNFSVYLELEFVRNVLMGKRLQLEWRAASTVLLENIQFKDKLVSIVLLDNIPALGLQIA